MQLKGMEGAVLRGEDGGGMFWDGMKRRLG